MAAVYFAVVFLVGTIGYVLIERWPWFDALYMAITTVTSVGFMEVHPLSAAGRVFTVTILILGVTGLGIWWGLITALIVELDLRGLLRRRRMEQKLSQLSKHFVICGAGRMGRVVVEEMVAAKRRFVVIEQSATQIQHLLELFPDALALEGDATKEHALEEARIEHARGLAACLSDDADNLLVSLTARGMCPKLTIVARAYDEESPDKLHRAGADHVISPNHTGGVRMASTLLRPSVVSFLDVATTAGDINLRLEEAAIPEDSPLVGQRLEDARIPQETGLIVLAVRRRESGAVVYNPGPGVTIGAGDVMIVLGEEDQVGRLREYARQGAR